MIMQSVTAFGYFINDFKELQKIESLLWQDDPLFDNLELVEVANDSEVEQALYFCNKVKYRNLIDENDIEVILNTQGINPPTQKELKQIQRINKKYCLDLKFSWIAFLA